MRARIADVRRDGECGGPGGRAGGAGAGSPRANWGGRSVRGRARGPDPRRRLPLRPHAPRPTPERPPAGPVTRHTRRRRPRRRGPPRPQRSPFLRAAATPPASRHARAIVSPRSAVWDPSWPRSAALRRLFACLAGSPAAPAFLSGWWPPPSLLAETPLDSGLPVFSWPPPGVLRSAPEASLSGPRPRTCRPPRVPGGPEKLADAPVGRQVEGVLARTAKVGIPSHPPLPPHAGFAVCSTSWKTPIEWQASLETCLFIFQWLPGQGAAVRSFPSLETPEAER